MPPGNYGYYKKRNSTDRLSARRLYIRFCSETDASLFRRFWQHFDRNRIDISETVPNRAPLLLERRHRPGFRPLLRSHSTLTRENEPLAIRCEPRSVLAPAY